MADNPAHYHAIERITDRWQQYLKGIQDAVIDTAEERRRARQQETNREVHTTGVPHSQKGG
jgi:hypothetical protein